MYALSLIEGADCPEYARRGDLDRTGHIVADRLKDYLFRHPEMEKRIEKKGDIHYLTTEKTGLFDRMAGMFMGENLAQNK